MLIILIDVSCKNGLIRHQFLVKIKIGKVYWRKTFLDTIRIDEFIPFNRFATIVQVIFLFQIVYCRAGDISLSIRSMFLPPKEHRLNATNLISRRNSLELLMTTLNLIWFNQTKSFHFLFPEKPVVFYFSKKLVCFSIIFTSNILFL